MNAEAETFSKPKIGVSACLLGEPVRYNAGHCRDQTITEEMAPCFEYRAVCPEMGIGMGAPRETVNLHASPQGPRMIGTKSGTDYTEHMLAFSKAKLDWIREEDLDGFLFKKKSPSCGMERIPIYNEKGAPGDRGSGLFAATVMAAFPLLPVEEEGRLNDKALKDNWVERVYAYNRWRTLLRETPTAGGLNRFHMRHKLTLLAHCEQDYRKLGPITARAGDEPIAKILEEYGTLFMQAMSKPATAKSHANTLQHAMGFLKEDLTSEDKAELVRCIEDFRLKRCPLSVPLTLLSSHFRRFPHHWITEQTYFAPYPRAFLMRQYFQP